MIAETKNIEESKSRTPVPLPRVKMMQPEDEVVDAERYSITQCIPHNVFPQFKIAEETFVGSGENSEDEFAKSESDIDDEDSIDN